MSTDTKQNKHSVECHEIITSIDNKGKPYQFCKRCGDEWLETDRRKGSA